MQIHEEPARPRHNCQRSAGQRDHNLAVDVASGLQCHGVTDLFNRKSRGDGHGHLAGKDGAGDPLQGIRR